MLGFASREGIDTMNAIGQLFIKLHTTLLRKTQGQKFNMGGTLLILNSTGAKTGKPRSNPLVHLTLDDGSYAITASAAGADRSPGWYHNLRAHPDAAVEIDGRRIPVHARFTEGDERDQLYAKFEALNPRFTGYKTKTQRTIPVVVLEPTARA